MTENERIWQWLDEHWEQFCEFWQTKSKDLSQADFVAYDENRIVGIMCDWVYQGVRKVVMVTPQSLVEGMSRLDEELRRRCEIAASSAETMATHAQTQGDYAKTEGDRVASLIDEITTLKERVRQQGNTAEAQGTRAQGIYETVNAWYNPFRDQAESWYSTETAAWNTFKNGAQTDFANWTQNEQTRQQNESLRVSQENTRKSNETTRQNQESTRNTNESTRQTNEAQRQENEEIRLDGTFRQNANTGKWERLNQRTRQWEDTGLYWLGGLIAYRFYTDPNTGRIHVVKNNTDRVNFTLVNGRLHGTYVD
jgi:hypothetical protein